MHKYDLDRTPSASPPANSRENEPLQDIQPFERPGLPSIATALARIFYLVLTVTELSLQLALLAVVAAIGFIPAQHPVNDATLSNSPTRIFAHPVAPEHSPEFSVLAGAPQSLTSQTSSPEHSPSASIQSLPMPRTFRPYYLPIVHFLRLFPHTEEPDAEWHTPEPICSEEIDLYDDLGEYNHGLQLEDLTQDDLALDDAEVAELARSCVSIADTFGNHPSVILTTPSSSSTTLAPPADLICTTTPSSDSTTLAPPADLICANCRAHRDHYDNSHPETATLQNIGWYCSPSSTSRAWFVVSVGRMIGVFDNWFVISYYYF